jgi:hypothetical protein
LLTIEVCGSLRALVSACCVGSRVGFGRLLAISLAFT